MPQKIVVIVNTLLLVALFTVIALFTVHIVRYNSWHYWKAINGVSYRTNVGSGQIQYRLGDGWWDVPSFEHPVRAGKQTEAKKRQSP